jgi:hypothetical protein
MPDSIATTWADVLALVNQQAGDEGLWFTAKTAPEGYLQQELRRLHAVIEACNPLGSGLRDG